VGTETQRTQRNVKANVTILDGQQADTVVLVPAGASLSTRLDGFTVRNGQAANGAGLYGVDTGVTVAHCVFRNNYAYNNSGGGIYLRGSLALSNSTFLNDTATYYGGGVFLTSSNALITGCTFTGCVAANSVGGGLYSESSSTVVANNLFSGNYALNNGGGL